MKLIKPAWVEHGGVAIYSVDVSPDDLRFATGGQGPNGGRVTIWNIGPLLEEELERDENVPKVLGQLDYHTKCVNCVRWNKIGDFLASCSDDKTVMIFRNSANYPEMSKNYLKQVDSWRLAGTLTGHQSDIIDLNWAPRKSWLASGSVDNTIIIWDIDKMNMLVQIAEHKGLVKGVAWDPLEQYIASQSNDKSVRVFRTKDWKEEILYRRPFEGSGDTTEVTRLDWSPDGQYIVCPNASKSGGPTARILCVTRPFPDVEPNCEDDEMDLVGHRKAVSCVKYHSRLWRTKPKSKTHCIFATGSRDGTVAIWSSARTRPVATLKNFFTTPVTDLCWSRNGFCLITCSPGGEIAAFHFKESELGITLTDEEQQAALEASYGSMARKTEIEGVVPIVQYAQNLVEETPMEVETNGVPSEVSKPPEEEKIEKKVEESTPKENNLIETIENNVFNPPVENGPTSVFVEQPKPSETETPVDVVRKKQLEVRRADGKRRVTPIALSREGPPAKIQVVIEETTSTTTETPKTAAKTPSKTVAPVAMGAPTMFQVSIPSTPVTQRPAAPVVRSVTIAQLEPVSTRVGVAVRIEGEDSDWLEVTTSKSQGILTVRRRSRNPDRLIVWEFLYGYPVSAVRSSSLSTIVSCTNATLHFLDPSTGIHRFSPIILPGQVAFISCVENKVLVVTTVGHVYIYKEGVKLFADTTLREILLNDKGRMAGVALGRLSNSGDPVLVLTNGLCIGWKAALASWTVLWDANSIVFRIGKDLAPVSSNKNLPLRSLADVCCRYASKATVKPRSENESACVETYLMHQLMAAQHLGSAIEYKFNLLALVRYYAQNGHIIQLEAFLNSLADENKFDLNLLKLTPKALMEECLTTLKAFNACERLHTQFEALLSVM